MPCKSRTRDLAVAAALMLLLVSVATATTSVAIKPVCELMATHTLPKSCTFGSRSWSAEVGEGTRLVLSIRSRRPTRKKMGSVTGVGIATYIIGVDGAVGGEHKSHVSACDGRNRRCLAAAAGQRVTHDELLGSRNRHHHAAWQCPSRSLGRSYRSLYPMNLRLRYRRR